MPKHKVDHDQVGKIRNRIPCAIYTRKSTDEGLDQAFNSLDAQYDACEAYIASQKHEGWKLITNRYDDGGISGGTLDRPGLEQLLHDVDHGLVKMIVVYKIDRLTRSLADFAKLVERMDEAGCSFVSVTQAFNTSTSMGRLTLNVLLSFAQFEREVTAERIRDKISASKAKGMWMGGYPPLGFDRNPDPNVRSLIINDNEAKHINTLFDLFEQYGNLACVEREAHKLGIRSKLHQFPKGKTRGGSLMSRGQIHALLSNPVHTGMIKHKKQVYEGLHQPIIARDRWMKVQKQLAKNANKPRAISLDQFDKSGCDPGVAVNTNLKNEMPTKRPLLRGLIFDEDGKLFTPSFSCKGNKRYHYYILKPDHKQGSKSGNSPKLSMRLPARQIEGLVHKTIHDLFASQHNVQNFFADLDVNELPQLENTCLEIAESIKKESHTVRDYLSKLTIGKDTLTIRLNQSQISDVFKLHSDRINADHLSLAVPFTKRRRGNETKLVSQSANRAVDKTLINTLGSSHRWLTMLKQNISLEKIAKQESRSVSYVRTRLPFALLSPKIQTAILNGTQPVELTADRLARMTIPMDFEEQEKLLGFRG
jgi:DNA invertase Pin-like site-specific DNA recombinase